MYSLHCMELSPLCTKDIMSASEHDLLDARLAQLVQSVRLLRRLETL
jgi:hypothetical protein